MDIEFKGKRIDNGEIVYGMLRRGSCAESVFRFIEVGGTAGRTYRVIPESVGHYIGLCDHNKKRIYVGDRLRHIYADMILDWIVCFEKGFFCVKNDGSDQIYQIDSSLFL